MANIKNGLYQGVFRFLSGKSREIYNQMLIFFELAAISAFKLHFSNTKLIGFIALPFLEMGDIDEAFDVLMSNLPELGKKLILIWFY